jgi:hypothetical protein
MSSDVVSFMKASSMVLSSFDLDCSGGNPRSGAFGSNDDGARRRYPCGHHFFGADVSVGDGVAPGETPDLGLPDQTMATRNALPAGGIIFGADLG